MPKQALDVARASRPAGPTSGQPPAELTAWVGPTSSDHQRRMGFPQAPRAVQDRIEKNDRTNPFPEGRRSLSGGSRRAGSVFPFLLSVRRPPDPRPFLHHPTETLDALAILKGGDCGDRHDLRPARKMTKQTQFRTTSLQSMGCDGFPSGAAGRSDSARPDRSLHGDTRRHRTQTGWCRGTETGQRTIGAPNHWSGAMGAEK